MTGTQTGMAVGAVLALAWMALGFLPFVLVALAMVVGAIAGRAIDGRLSLATMVEAFRVHRTSS